MRSTIFGLVLIIASQLMAATPEQSPRQLIPAVASTDGVGGSYWRTDLVVYNPNEKEVILSLQLLPTGGGGAAPFVDLLPPLGSEQTVVLEDVVGSHFPDDATGALVLLARDADSTLAAPVVASTRTWTPGGAGVGSYGQGIPALPWPQDGTLSETERIIPGLESSGDFRTNLGIVNPTAGFDEIFSVEILDAAGDSRGVRYYRLEAESHLQLNDLLRQFGLEGSDYTAVVKLVNWQDAESTTGNVRPDFVVYGSLVDQRSNDPTYLEAQTETTQSGLPRHRLIPAAAKTAGADGSAATL